MRHLKYIKFDRENLHWIFSIVQSADIRSLIFRPNLGDLKSVAEHVDSSTVKVQVSIRTTPRSFWDGIGDAWTLEENIVSGLC